ncbi:MAG: cytidine deaminase [Chloroflexota bacterium]
MTSQPATQPKPPQGVRDNGIVTDEIRRTLIAAARRARQYAYAPYSQYLVGAALLGANGEIYTGCNVENAAYPATICGERVALVKAVSEGIRSFKAIAVVTENGGFPCGTCRQMLYEFEPNLPVIVADAMSQVKYEGLLSDLLPGGFGPAQLEKPDKDATP